MASAPRIFALVLAWVTAVLLGLALLAGLLRWGERLREEHCNRFARTHARIEAAQGADAQPGRAGREEQDGCAGHVSFVAPRNLTTPLNSVVQR